MNNTECPIIDTFSRSLIVSDSHFNSVSWLLYGSETWYKTYTNTDLLLAVNSIHLTRQLALRRCPKIHGVRSLIPYSTRSLAAPHAPGHYHKVRDCIGCFPILKKGHIGIVEKAKEISWIVVSGA